MKNPRYFVRVTNGHVALGSFMMRSHRPSGPGWVEIPGSVLGICCAYNPVGGGSAPFNFVAAAGSPSTSVNNLSWSAKAGATSYTLERSTAADFSTGLTTVYTGSGTSYANTGLTSGVAYYYRLSAVTPDGTTGYTYASRTPA